MADIVREKGSIRLSQCAVGRVARNVKSHPICCHGAAKKRHEIKMTIYATKDPFAVDVFSLLDPPRARCSIRICFGYISINN
jgi:hypothetical protein